MVIFLLILLIPVSYMFYKSTYGVYKHNRLHEHWETRIVKTETGKFQVQEWLGNLYSPEDDYICYWQEAKSFLKKATFDTLEEAKAAKAEHDKTYNDIKNRDVLDKVIEGAEN